MKINPNQMSNVTNEADILKNISAPVQNAKEGGISNVALGYTKDCSVQKDSGINTYTKDMATKASEEIGLQVSDTPISPADFIKSCVSGEDVMSVEDEGTPLEEYTSSQLERAITRIKKERADKKEAVEAEVERNNEREQCLEKMAEENLPTTPENVARISHAVNMASEISSVSEDAMKYFIGNNLTITPENISASVMASASVTTRSIKGDTFSQIENQVKDILEKGNIEATQENMDIARWLYENDYAVTADNVKTYQNIEELKNLEADALMERIVEGVADGATPEKTELTKLTKEETKEQIEKFTKTPDDKIRTKYSNEADFIKAKRQLEQIRLTMTVSAARTMSAKGIRLDIIELDSIVEDLKLQEKQAKQEMYFEAGLDIEEDSEELLFKTVDAAKSVLDAPANILSTTFSVRTEITVSELSVSAKDMTAQFSRMEMSYEAVGTEVRRDLGDSISKAFNNVDDILNEMNLDVTAANERAVRILGYNSLEISEESINQMKLYDAKVNSLMSALKPGVVAKLVKNNINPLEMTIDELSEEVNKIDSVNTKDDISFKKFIWQMDHHGGLTSEERETMIGIYRLLDKIEKSDGALIGQVVNEGKELSFKSLLSAYRTAKKTGLDITVDEQFGGIEDVVSKGTSISEQIQAAYAADLKKNISVKTMADFLQEEEDVSIEEWLESNEIEDRDIKEYYEEMTNDAKNIIAGETKEVTEFLKNLEMPETLGNVLEANEFLTGKRSASQKLWTSEESEEAIENFDEPDELEKILEKIDDSHEKELEKTKESDDITYESIKDIARMVGGISFYKNLRNNQMYEIPIFTKDGITNCNVTIMNGTSNEKGKVEVAFESEELGRVLATFKVNASKVSGFVTAENQDSFDECQAILERFKNELSANGMSMENESLIKGNRNSSLVGSKREDVNNKTLYQVAKMFIVSVKSNS